MVTGWFVGYGQVKGTKEQIANLARPLEPRGRVSEQMMETCRRALKNAAEPLGAKRVEAVSAGTETTTADGAHEAPLEVRILYQGASAYEVVQSRVTCRVDAAGATIAEGGSEARN